MPYVITTTDTRLYADDPTAEFMPDAKPVQTRRAVATLEEAKRHANGVIDGSGYAHIEQVAESYSKVDALSSAGGLVGPLPNGTIIDVECIGWQELARRLCTVDLGTEVARAADIDTYNSLQAFHA